MHQPQPDTWLNINESEDDVESYFPGWTFHSLNWSSLTFSFDCQGQVI